MNQRGASIRPMSRQWHAAAIDAVAATLESAIPRGLSAAEAGRRLGVYGPNRILEAEAVSPLGILARQFTSIVVLVLIAAAVLAAVLGDLLDGAAIAAIIVLNAAIGFFQEYRAETAVAELARMTAPRARVLRGGEAMTVAADEVVPGDLLLVEAGDLVAADARIVESAGLETNEAPLTGESVPVAKTGSECDGSTPLAERRNMIFLGTAATRGPARDRGSDRDGDGVRPHSGDARDGIERADAAAAPSGPGRQSPALVLPRHRRDRSDPWRRAGGIRDGGFSWRGQPRRRLDSRRPSRDSHGGARAGSFPDGAQARAGAAA